MNRPPYTEDQILAAEARSKPDLVTAPRAEHDRRFDDAYDRLCESVADPRRTRVTVRAADLRIVLTELVHRK